MSQVSLREFLGEGYIIRTKHCESPNWVTNVVYGINEESIEIDMGLEKDYIDNIIMVGDTMKCKYTTDDAEYSILGWVTRINTGIPQSITIKVHQIEKFGNKRDSYRFDVYLSAVVKKNRDDSKGIFSIVTNISRTGAAFIVRDDLEKLFNMEESSIQNSTFHLEVFITSDKFFVFEGEIIRKCNKEKGIEYGVRIFDIDLDSEKMLVEFITELENKDKEFYNKRSGFWSKNSKLNK